MGAAAFAALPAAAPARELFPADALGQAGLEGSVIYQQGMEAAAVGAAARRCVDGWCTDNKENA